jgi:hypothetical protein
MRKRRDWDSERRAKRIRGHGSARIDPTDQALTKDGRPIFNPKQATKPNPPPDAKISLKGRRYLLGQQFERPNRLTPLARQSCAPSGQRKSGRRCGRPRRRISIIVRMPLARQYHTAPGQLPRMSGMMTPRYASALEGVREPSKLNESQLHPAEAVRVRTL